MLHSTGVGGFPRSTNSEVQMCYPIARRARLVQTQPPLGQAPHPHSGAELGTPSREAHGGLAYTAATKKQVWLNGVAVIGRRCYIHAIHRRRRVYASDVGWYPDEGRRGKDNGVAHLGMALWGSVTFAL